MTEDDVEIREMRAFLVLAEVLSFARAADMLDVSQPALTRLIQRLERKVGARLLDRTTRRVALTPAGHGFRADTGDVIARLEAACDAARRFENGSLGTLRIGYNDFAICGPLARVVREFRTRFPDAHATLARRSTQHQLSDLAAGELDVAFVIPPVNDPDLVSREAWSDPLLVVMAEGHPLADRASVGLRELAGTDLVAGVPDRWRAYRRRLEALFQTEDLVPRLLDEGPDTQAILGLVEAGFGVAILPGCVANVARSGLKMGPLGFDPPRREYIATHVAWRREKDGPLLRNFLDALDGTVGKTSTGAGTRPLEAEAT